MKWDVSSDKSLPLWAINTEVIAMVPCPLRLPPSKTWGGVAVVVAESEATNVLMELTF